MEKAAQNLPVAPAPGQLPAPDADGIWNPPPLRPMAKVETTPESGPKVDWNGRPPGAEAPVAKITLPAKSFDAMPIVIGTGVTAPVAPVAPVVPESSGKIDTSMAPEDNWPPPIPKSVFKAGKTRGRKSSMTYTARIKKPPRKPRNPGVYEVFMGGRVQGADGVLEVLIRYPGGQHRDRSAAERVAVTWATENPGKPVEVHRRLSRMTVEKTATVKLVRN